MMRRIRISAGAVSATATLDESRTALAIWAALPIEMPGETWGDEIYFAIPVALPDEGARAVVDAGDLGYWPPGRAFCIFFGPTPASRGTEIRPASPVNVFGRLEGEAGAREVILEGVDGPHLLAGVGGSVVDAGVPDERAEQAGGFGGDAIVGGRGHGTPRGRT